jgi:hypothetical protein
VLHRSASGTWTSGTAATVAEGLTRPQIALDTTNRLVYVVMSTEGGGSVYYKTAPFGPSPKFTPATGTGPTMLAWSGAAINNATLAKAPISAGSGLIVLASDEKNTRRYYHAELPLGPVAPGDTTPPTVTATNPASGATGVAVAGNVTATFSEPMTATTITASTFTLKNGTTSVPAAVTYDATSRVATLNPSADLANNTTYTATVTTGVKDTAGLAMTSARTWSFTTAAASGGTDTTPPTVTATSPAAGATAVAVAGNLTATFSEPMTATTVNGTTFTLKNGTTAVAAAVSYDATSRVATLNPSADLANNTTYTATVTTGVKDAAGLAMTSDKTWSFTTAAASGGTGTTVTLTTTEDSHVSSGAAGTNFGTAAALVTDGSPIEISYLKFDLRPYAGKTVTGATLQVRAAASGSTGKQNVKLVGVDTWTETGITYSNRPALGTAVGSVGPTSINTNYNITLAASSLQGDVGQLLSLGMDSTSTDGLDLNSGETAYAPKLVLTFAP